jgi:uncharacterized protein YheU (UPF0270 family)
MERTFGVNVIPVDSIERKNLENLLKKMLLFSDYDDSNDSLEFARDSVLLREDILSYDSDLPSS